LGNRSALFAVSAQSVTFPPPTINFLVNRCLKTHSQCDQPFLAGSGSFRGSFLSFAYNPASLFLTLTMINKAATFVLLFAAFAIGQTTRTWEQSSFDDFEKGVSHGVAVRSDGVLELAPAFRAVATTPSTFIWAVASDAEGNLLAATGAPARVYRITPQGHLSNLLQPAELEVQAIAVARDGTIYAATSPDGKIYRIHRNAPPAPRPRKAEKQIAAQRNVQTPSQNNAAAANSPAPEAPQLALDPDYTSTVFFEPRTKYIWALALDAQGRLYIATGDRGEIYRVELNGSGSVFFKSDEAHIRSITFDKAGNLIAGSDGSGLVYRISPAGEAFVLYSAPKKEITALALDAQGNIYAAAAGDKRANPSAPAANIAPANAVEAAATFSQLPLPGIGSTGSEVYRIAPDGSPRRIWQSHDDLVYALAFDPAGRLLAGTGNKGKIYALSTGESRFTDLLKASANQVIGFASAPNGGLWAATSNLGKIFLLEEAAEHEGTFDSDVFDAKIFSRWGHIELRASGNVELFARSGNVDNPDRNWSPWQKIDLAHDAALQAPAARFVQWRIVLHSGLPWPQVESVALNYLPKNVAPVVDDVTVFVGHKFPQAPRLVADVANSIAGTPPGDILNQSLPQPQPDRDSIAVRWSARDDNDDQLSYSVFYRGEAESRWQLLKPGLADKFYSFESGLLPDGRYVIRVIASDAPSHSPEEFLTAARESSTFDVDNTPPIVGGLTARIDETGLHVTFRASDNYSIIRRAEFSIDAGDWQFVAPVGGISDTRTENYDFTVPVPRDNSSNNTNPSPGAQEAIEVASPSAGPSPSEESAARRAAASIEHVVVVRIFDRADNVGTAKVVVRAGNR
jgi:sugar lactone lactonase YvrE